jgi:hypothetical protein
MDQFSRHNDNPGLQLRKAMSEQDSVETTPSIGVVWMERDRSIVVKLRAEGPDGIIGDAQFIFKRRSPRYEQVMRYLGGMKPGEARSLKEWDFALKGNE